jgi:Restriction endonuclease
MPEELAIALLVLFAIGWVCFKFISAASRAISDAHTGFLGTVEEMRVRRFEERKAALAPQIRFLLPDDMDKSERALKHINEEFQSRRAKIGFKPVRPTWEKKTFPKQLFSRQSQLRTEMNIAEIDAILCPDPVPWSQKEITLLAQRCAYPSSAPVGTCEEFHEFIGSPFQIKEATFEFDPSAVREKDVVRYFLDERTRFTKYNERRLEMLSRHTNLAGQIAEWNTEEYKRWKNYCKDSANLLQEETEKFKLHSEQYTKECSEQVAKFKAVLDGFKNGVKECVIERIGCILGSLSLPSSVPRSWYIDFDEEQHILIVEVFLPDVVHRPPAKIVPLKSGFVAKPLNQSERKEYIPKVHPAILLRIGFEIARNDISGTIKLLVINGWVQFLEPTTGLDTKAYTASLMAEPSQLATLNLKSVDPLAAFQNLHGKSAGKLIEIIPIEPTLNLKRTDSRFVDAKEVLNRIDNSTNLASMDWQDFEHLIRELFEKEFSGRGAEVKITQASRDRGVDAIVFDPDPIHGGKYVIQAKRYVNTVDVSAVRDLCAVVRKEGASRGILVTTSTYGGDAYAFANNEPVTLLNGAELLGLLKKHGYDFRVNLTEARQLKLNHAGGEAGDSTFGKR